MDANNATVVTAPSGSPLVNWAPTSVIKIRERRRLAVIAVDETQMGGLSEAARPLLIDAHMSTALQAATRLDRTFASHLAGVLPEAAAIRTRSGDLGEVLAADYVRKTTAFDVIFRLRFKEDRNLPMRGDDILGVRGVDSEPLRYLKGEVKSGRRPGRSVIGAARRALQKDLGLPNPGSKAFIQNRLFEQGDTASLRLAASLRQDLRAERKRVAHLMFILSGRDITELLKEDLTALTDAHRHQSTLMVVHDHEAFIADVYNGVLDDD